MDAQGRKIKSFHSDFGNSMNVSELKMGIYVIRAFLSSGVVASQKVIMM